MSAEADASVVLELIGAFRRSKAMFTAVRLGVFDELESNSQTAKALAAKLDLNASALSRLLDACVALGLLHRADDSYHNASISSRYLVAASPDTLAGYIIYSDESLYPLWSHLDDAVREGTNRWTQRFGSRDALFSHYFRDEASTAAFLGGMHGFGQITSPLVVKAFDLGGFPHLVDLGGATGHLAIAACEAYPSLTATVFDLVSVEPFARIHISRSRAAERIRFIAADFFKDALPEGDLYALGRVVHDWSEPQISALLRKIYDALPAGGGLLIAETLVDEDRSGPVYALMQDLNMLVCTDGKERTFSEYRGLLEAVGFGKVHYRRTGSVLDALLARK
ncbi:MAG: class I SAM-dependent methyltransferase [Bryobacteraceae bacterium]